MLKKLIRMPYHFTHDVLYETASWNPIFKKIYGRKTVQKGFIGDEHLTNSTLDDHLFHQLKAAGIACNEHYINQKNFENYLATATYPKEYYGAKPGHDNFTEKALEHYVTLEFIDFSQVQCFVDVAACTSPFADIISQKFKVAEVYKQDLVYPPGINGNKIGGYAHEMNLPTNSVDALTLHCSLEHFEDNTDILLFRKMNRLLRKGGKALILPFYLAHSYTIHVDPAYNLLRRHFPAIDEEAELRYCNWYQFHSRHYDIIQLQKRIIAQLPDCHVVVYRIMNFRQIWQHSYLRWVLEITHR